MITKSMSNELNSTAMEVNDIYSKIYDALVEDAMSDINAKTIYANVQLGPKTTAEVSVSYTDNEVAIIHDPDIRNYERIEAVLEKSLSYTEIMDDAEKRLMEQPDEYQEHGFANARDYNNWKNC